MRRRHARASPLVRSRAPRLGHVHTRTWRGPRQRSSSPHYQRRAPLFPCAWAAHIPPVCRFCALAGRIALPSWSSARTLRCWTEWTRKRGRIGLGSRILDCVAPARRPLSRCASVVFEASIPAPSPPPPGGFPPLHHTCGPPPSIRSCPGSVIVSASSIASHNVSPAARHHRQRPTLGRSFPSLVPRSSPRVYRPGDVSLFRIVYALPSSSACPPLLRRSFWTVRAPVNFLPSCFSALLAAGLMRRRARLVHPDFVVAQTRTLPCCITIAVLLVTPIPLKTRSSAYCCLVLSVALSLFAIFSSLPRYTLPSIHAHASMHPPVPVPHPPQQPANHRYSSSTI